MLTFINEMEIHLTLQIEIMIAERLKGFLLSSILFEISFNEWWGNFVTNKYVEIIIELIETSNL